MNQAVHTGPLYWLWKSLVFLWGFFHWEIGNQLLSPFLILAFPPSYIFFHFCPPPFLPLQSESKTLGKSILPFFLPISYFSLPPPYFGSPLPCTERTGSVLLFLLSLFIPIYHHIPCFSFTESKNLFPLFLPFFSFSFFLSFFHFCLPFPYSGGHLPCGDWASRSPGFCHPAINPSLHHMCAYSWQLFQISHPDPIAVFTEQSQEHWNKL